MSEHTTVVVPPAPAPSSTVTIAPARALATVVAPAPPAPRTVVAAGPRAVLAVDVAHVHAQAVPAATWSITHRLTFIPNVTVVDSAGSAVIGAVAYPDANSVVVDFSTAFAGTAYLS